GVLILRQHDRARRHLDDAVFAPCPRTVAPHAVDAALGLEVLLVAVIDQRVEIGHAFDDHIATATAVAAVRPTEFDELLAPEAQAAVAAITGFDIDLGEVEKLHGRRLQKRTPVGRSSSYHC